MALSVPVSGQETVSQVISRAEAETPSYYRFGQTARIPPWLSNSQLSRKEIAGGFGIARIDVIDLAIATALRDGNYEVDAGVRCANSVGSPGVAATVQNTSIDVESTIDSMLLLEPSADLA